jgi:uncharacterized protein YjbI with pentapeptide repeats
MGLTFPRLPSLPHRRPSDAVVAGGVGAALIGAGVIAGTVTAWAEVYGTVRVIALAVSHYWPVALLAVGALVAVVAIRRPGRRRDAAERASWWFRHRWAMAAAAVLVVAGGLVLTTVATVVLAHLTGYYDRPPVEKLSDLIKIALTVTGGTGAAVALVVAYRRQKITEGAHELARTTARDTRHDASERRITEQYTQAVAQLGHAKAPVRLGGLYALERVGQSTPDLWQVVVDVLCAYLRMPPPSTETQTDQPPDNGPAAASAAHSDRTSAEPGAEVDRREEHQVRLTAQRILADHLRDPRLPDQRAGTPSRPRFWDGMTLDLTAATLADLDLTDCHAHHVTFRGATFTGDTHFDGATFTGDADFRGATFTGDADFRGATFTGGAYFAGATFTGDADFGGRSFLSPHFIGWVTFGGDADFHGATFTGGANFGSRATFTPGAGLGGRWITAGIGGPTFTGGAWFGGATFTGHAWFGGATFTRHTSFGGATFGGRVTGLLERDEFGGWTLGPVPDRPHLQQLVPPDPVPAAPRGGPEAPAEPGGAPAESAFDAASDGQDGETEQDRAEEPQGDLEYPPPEGERHGLGGAEQ